MSRPAFPTPGTTFGPDAASLDDLREVLRAWPMRGEWRASIPDSAWPIDAQGCAEFVLLGETWTLVRDTQPAEPAPARTVTVSVGWTFYVRADDGGHEQVTTWPSREDAARGRAYAVNAGRECGPVVEVRAALPLPVEPAVVVGTVVTKEVSDAE